MTMFLTDFPDEYNANVQKIINDTFANSTLFYTPYFNVSEDGRYSIPVPAYSSFGSMQTWNDGENVPTDDAVKRFTTTFTQVGYGLAFKVSRQHVKYGMLAQINKWAGSLGSSGAATLNTVHANILNNAFSSTHGDGTYLCSASHPVSGSTASNTLGSVALSTTSIDTMNYNGLETVDYKGKPTPIIFNKIIVPAELARKASQIVGSTQEYGTTDNQINYYQGKYQVIADPHLTSATAWFMQAANHGLASYVGKAFSTDNYIEDSSKSLVHRAELDFVCGVEDWYGMYGSSGA